MPGPRSLPWVDTPGPRSLLGWLWLVPGPFQGVGIPGPRFILEGGYTRGVGIQREQGGSTTGVYISIPQPPDTGPGCGWQMGDMHATGMLSFVDAMRKLNFEIK